MSLLEVKGLEVRYGRIRAVKGIDLAVEEGELVCLIGANGAGKSSTLRAISGLTGSAPGAVRYAGRDLAGTRAFERVRLEDACGRILTERIVADADYPSAPRSAMDGFAIESGAAPGRFVVPLRRVPRTVDPVTVCVRNLGTRAFALVGVPGAKLNAVKVDGKPTDGVCRTAFFRPGSETWWALLPTLAHRFSLAKANWVGAWAFWALIVLLAVALGLVVRVAVVPPRSAE